MISELVFGGGFEGLKGDEVCALLSMFVCDEGGKGDETQTVKDEKMQNRCLGVLEVARKVWRIFQESKIQIDEMDYISTFKTNMVDVTLHWCRGASFAEICKMSNLFEGSIIRCLRRLDELLKQLGNAAKAIGN